VVDGPTVLGLACFILVLAIAEQSIYNFNFICSSIIQVEEIVLFNELALPFLGHHLLIPFRARLDHSLINSLSKDRFQKEFVLLGILVIK
jgi:hypothetical protein